MTKGEAAYFLEGLVAGAASPSARLAKALFAVLAKRHGLTAADFDDVRKDIDDYLTEAENSDDAA
jgi:hypothetical protein